MGFSKTETTQYSTEYNLDDPVDRELIRIFESELEAFAEREPVTILHGTILERKISGYQLYLHEHNLFRYSLPYPNGAIVSANVGLYRDVEKKRRALENLKYRRILARDAHMKQLEGTEVGKAAEMLGGEVVDLDPETKLKKLEVKKSKVTKKMKL